MDEKNWAGNLTYHGATLARPETMEQLQALVSSSAQVKALGTRHSFDDIADTDGGVLISLEHFNDMRIDPVERTVTIGGGVRYGDLGEYLQREGWALGNLASLPHITVAGACATATHGSGVTNRCLPASIARFEIVNGCGELVPLDRDRDGERFQGAVAGLGALGLMTRLSVEIEPAYQMAQNVFENLPFAELETHFDEIMSSAYSVSLFTHWRDENFHQVWLKRRVSNNMDELDVPAFFGATAARGPMHPVEGNDPVNCTPQMGVPGPWNERLPHFQYRFKPSAGDELQSEYLIPYDDAVEALRRLWPLGESMRDVLWVSEVRVVDRDDLWMSMCHGRKSIAIHFTWKKDWAQVRQLLPVIEEALAPFAPRPHWGKLFTMPAEYVHKGYSRLADFRELAREFDPEGKFRNRFLDRYVFAG